MKTEEYFSILKKIVIMTILFFLGFILFINIFSVLDFGFKVKKVVDSTRNDIDISVIDSKLNKVNEDYILDEENKKHDAEELGFKNDLYDLDGSEWGDGINILLIGSDKKNFSVEKGRADVIMVLRITKTGKILSISIPRDTLIKINNGKWRGKPDKIGHSFYWGGLENLKKSVEDLLASPIQKVIIVDNFRSFEAFTAVLGGLKMDKELEGKTALQWIRNRNFRDGDIERCKRQELFLKKSAIKIWKMTKNGSYIYSYMFFDFLNKIVTTDLTKDDFKKIFYVLKKNNFNPEKDFLIGVLPGNFGKYNSVILRRKNLDCWNLDQKVINNMQFLFYSEKDNYEEFLNEDASIINFLKIDLSKFIKNGNK
jgi:anionic cell wall polymer biosynthesis LytR-Cps2A-Psr (LCP) family protein